MMDQGWYDWWISVFEDEGTDYFIKSKYVECDECRWIGPELYLEVGWEPKKIWDPFAGRYFRYFKSGFQEADVCPACKSSKISNSSWKAFAETLEAEARNQGKVLIICDFGEEGKNESGNT